MFQLTIEEWEQLWSQIVTTSRCDISVRRSSRKTVKTFKRGEANAQQADISVEFWLAREVQHHTEWRNFTAVVSKAKIACEVSNHPISDHFVEVIKMVDLGSGSQRTATLP